MDFIAHTPPKERPNMAPHGYAKHIHEMVAYGVPMFEHLLSFVSCSHDEKAALAQTFKAALMLHDMGKLDDANQRVFRGEVAGPLPVDHIEGGVAVAAEMQNELLGWMIRGHHSPGLPSRSAEKYFIRTLRKQTGLALGQYSLRGKRHKRNKSENWQIDWQNHAEAIRMTDERLDLYKQRQRHACGDWPQVQMPLPSSALWPRLMLSCLVDADHSSAAAYSQGQELKSWKPASVRWEDRLSALDRYVENLSQPSNSSDSGRNAMRRNFYSACRNGLVHDSRLACCSAPVGLGKTTSVLAYLLRCAIQRGASRIFIVAPFSSIIEQTVRTLRLAVVLDGETPEKIVVGHHHRADFSSKDMRQYAASWEAPIVVTTSVQFFETLAEASPTRLRKLHNVVGAAVFMDESHACLPTKLLNTSWHWIRQLANSWGCHFVFASGSIVRFWENEHLVSEGHKPLPDIMPESLRSISAQADRQRIARERLEEPLGCAELVETMLPDSTQCKACFSQAMPSCLVVMNTVQSAAVVADSLAVRLGDGDLTVQNKQVLHLSTALTPADRARILKEVERRQKVSEWNTRPWYLVATSCVEAGVDLDFSIGFREICSVNSFIQMSGRVNRHGKRKMGLLCSFSIIPEAGLIKHPGFDESSAIFQEMWEELAGNTLDNSLVCTKAVQNEFVAFPKRKEEAMQLLKNEKDLAFQEVSKNFNLIESNTFTVVVNDGVVKRMEQGHPVGWQAIQKHSIQLWASRIESLGLSPIANCGRDDIYAWPYAYEQEFLGIMRPVLANRRFFQQGGAVVS